MKYYDVVVIGSGSGMTIVEGNVSLGKRVALIEKDYLGGTCLNVGCIPSKMLIYPADRIVEILEAKKLGVTAKLTSVDFKNIMDRMRESVSRSRDSIISGIKSNKELDFYEAKACFIDEHTMEAGGERIRGDKIYIASGSRPFLPPIKGLEITTFLDNEGVLGLDECPESIIIIGGGYIACEYGHFFAAMGARTTIIEMTNRLLKNEEPEISSILQKNMEKRMKVMTTHQAEEVIPVLGGVIVKAKDLGSGKVNEFKAQCLMVAAGRRSNSDILKTERAGLKLRSDGYIETNNYLETNKPHIWTIGDANGVQMYRHVANREAELVWYNSIHQHKVPINYLSMPHAVFSHPQIASVGLTEIEAKEKYQIMIGISKYSDTAKGEAMMETNGLCKIIARREDARLLGCHIIGPYAPILIQEVVNVIALEGNVNMLDTGTHIHPALPEVIPVALSRLRPI
jgi:dihydrolipoamide dehydrogenase